MRILIAEDERVTRRSLQKRLEAWGHEVVAATDGAEAWEEYCRQPFDMVVTDWEMPNVDGRELIRRIRERPDTGYTYLIMLTSHSETAEVVLGMEAGADDFLGKPFDRNELEARLLAGERIIRTERALSDNIRKLRESQARVERDLQAAARLQQLALPRPGLAHPNVTIEWRYTPCDELGGDGVGFSIVQDRYLAAYVLDVTGHGVPAALLSYSVSQALSPAVGLGTLAEGQRDELGLGPMRSPGDVLTRLNERFPSEAADGRFFTIHYSVIDLETGLMRCASAGHPEPCLLREGDPINLGDFGNLPIGVLPDVTYETASHQLTPGERLFIVSDGFTEAQNENNGLFGAARIVENLQTRADATLSDSVDGLIQDATAWANNNFDDDLSIAALQWH